MQKSARLTEEDLHKAGYTVVGNEAVPLGEARPDPSWEEDRLAVYAKGELASSKEADRQAILQAHKSAVHLFRAGHALALARDKCKGEKHGAWTEFKERHGLAHTTANDAIRLYENAKTEDALAGLGITEAKEKFVYPEKGTTDEEGSQDLPQQPKKPRGGRGHQSHQGGGHAKVPAQESESPDPAAPSPDHGHATAEEAGDTEHPAGTLAEELKEMAQRLSEIALNEWGKLDWSVENVGDVRLAVLAINKAIATLIYKVKHEAKHS